MTDRITYRLKFSKLSRVRFIGHLDLLNVFQRSFNRAKLPVAYSRGFNPHQEISFALPLSLGYHSTGEYLDVVFDKEVQPEEIIEKINGALPEGLKVLGARKLNQGEKNSASVIALALYEVSLPQESKISSTEIEAVLKSEVIEVVKKGKKKETTVNIRPDIYSLSLKEDEGIKVISMLISAGSERNLKAELLIKYLCDLCEEPYVAYKMAYKRVEMYRNGKNGFLSLMESEN